MKVGDLVKRKPEWGDWVKYNPWMYTQEDLEIGIVIKQKGRHAIVFWPDGKVAEFKKKELEKVNESR